MTQLVSTASACAACRKMRLLAVFNVICFAAVGAAQESNDVAGASTVPPPTEPMTIATTVYNPPVPILKNKLTWLDVFPSEKVELSCVIPDSSEWTINWLKDNVQFEGNSIFVLSQERSVLTFTASDSSSGEYSCQGVHKKTSKPTQQSTSLKVTVLDTPKVSLDKSLPFDPLYRAESITLTCTIDGSPWEYVWSHNGKEIKTSSSNTYTITSLSNAHSGQYKCKARRGAEPFYTSEGQVSLTISEPPTPSLRQLSEPDVFYGEKVELSCDVNSPEWYYTWYKDGNELKEGLNGGGSTFIITSAKEANQGAYTCKAHHKSRKVTSESSTKTNIRVDDIPQATLSRTKGFEQMYVGETANFTCTVPKGSHWTYVWLKDGTQLSNPTKDISINLKLTDSGNYSCTAKRGEKTQAYESEEMQQLVHEIPVPSLKDVTGWLDVFPEERVELSCEIKGSWKYKWYKDGKEIHGAVTVSTDGGRATLSISSASAADGGEYTCKGQLADRPVASSLSSGLTLKVYRAKPSVTLTQDPQYNQMFSGESVVFTCHVNVSSGWEYEWYKTEEPKKLLGISSNKLPISSMDLDDVIYTCRAKRGKKQPFSISQEIHIDVVEKPKPTMTQDPNAKKLYNGESVSFECEVKEGSDWEYNWFKDGASILLNHKVLEVRNASSKDNGTYKCKAIRTKTKYESEWSEELSLYITEIPVPKLKKETNWLDVFPTESFELGCGVEPRSDWTYSWYRDGKKIEAKEDVSFKKDRISIIINSASYAHRGNYSCRGHLKARKVTTSSSPSITLQVYDTEPKVTLIQTPEHSLMHTSDSAKFLCHINVSTGWSYQWYKGGQPINGKKNFSYEIHSVSTSDSGTYKCQVRRGDDYKLDSEALSLKVEERPQAEITLLTGWSDVFSTDVLALRCEVKNSQNRWNYTWFKDKQEVLDSDLEKHLVTPQNDPDQSTYTCRGNSTERPTYSKLSDEFKTKNLLLKRRVLLSISGCIFFSIIAIFIGCIVLRVIRKPAPSAERTEEPNLFLTMAELKDRNDAPSPLVEYITDKDINAPVKGEEENDLLSSDTTSLLIPVENVQAATTENQDKEENGGMVSFK